MHVQIEGNSKEDVKRVSEKLGFKWDDAVFGSVDKIYKDVKGRDILSEATLLFKQAEFH